MMHNFGSALAIYIDFYLCDCLDCWTNEKVIIFYRLQESGSSIVVVVVVVFGVGVIYRR